MNQKKFKVILKDKREFIIEGDDSKNEIEHSWSNKINPIQIGDHSINYIDIKSIEPIDESLVNFHAVTDIPLSWIKYKGEKIMKVKAIRETRSRVLVREVYGFWYNENFHAYYDIELSRYIGEYSNLVSATKL